ncbi:MULTISPECIES: NAD-dependent succinate-semialdehyde dehydrogenase [Rhizobium/Agrobacterium group]|uniref:NAD-dependent succinate-semialdehyde dehydrogenase n=2 Tax=Agrobacterium TaxID=357 RepID=A0A546XJ97_AGRTU|nr:MULTISPECIES: NAD-dependent succinate-semialdehyde dehydrogenase [Rhizobium/Agrobacterium group]MCZ7472411.1 NAD-dependent succinate-semialdehyde dehydrogenase [Rhizobium rhizogenes]MCZ7483722.1 NAD-dependent succinate-semialdehyde dehydrogenase [Rhizobium rhizogenes]MEB3046202.1 NAD-dependent succinate-semialdehyde dehydrogenase [Rhizobium sp. MJ21]TRB00826.1 NAD-dependent succinate-semialdehyde dehydrogenase [Agrobacterium tumefaciens]WHO11824.1 NAD-dependent succinate-semialdehyde dehydr
MAYPNTKLYIGGEWSDASGGKTLDVVNPINGEVIGNVAHASRTDLERAVQAVASGFKTWSATSAFERYKVIRRAASLLRDRLEDAARLLTTDEGKPLSESRLEVNSCADLLDWFAEEGRRTYGRVIPSRGVSIQQYAVKDPVGPAVGFTPWNFPMSQIVRKLGPAISAGCSIIIKGPEEAPAAPAVLFQCLHDAGVPAGVVNLVFGTPSEISEFLVPHPVIRKVSFTGSVQVGKHLASLAGLHMKRVTMELGGHAPVIVADDANIDAATTALVAAKFRNGGQVCISPTRFLIQTNVHDEFVDSFVKKTKALKVGDGLADGVQVGPLINERRRAAVESLIEDAVSKGAKIETGGHRIGNSGFFFEPTVLTGVTTEMRAMNEEPFGPVALVKSFSDLGEAIEEAGRLPFGLGSYAWTSSASNARRLAQGVQAGMLSINHIGLGLPETPYGGVRDSGYGYEGGSEALEAYMNTRFITHDAN